MVLRSIASSRAITLHLPASGSSHLYYSSHALLMQMMVEKVPALGESITEGSVSAWTKAVGERVEVDDVVVIIETDKVSVDIKSTVAGVLTRQIGGNDDVAVGDDLFEIDTEGEASVASTPPAPEPVAAASTPVTAPTQASHSRTPLIKFLGKRSLIKATPAQSTAAMPYPSQAEIKDGGGVDFRTLGAWFGRPQLSDREMEAIESGGASEI